MYPLSGVNFTAPSRFARISPSGAEYSGGAAMKTRRRESFNPQTAHNNPLPANNSQLEALVEQGKRTPGQSIQRIRV
jgi:hypothetical protein